MKKSLLVTCAIFMALGNKAQLQDIKTGVENATGERHITAQSQSQNIATTVSDTLHYYYNKNFWLNPPGQWNQFYYWEMPSATASLNGVTHMGSIFQNSVSITVHGLEGMVMKNPASTSAGVPIKFYLHYLNATNQPLPPIDSAVATVTGTTGAYFVGGLLTSPKTVTANFAVSMKSEPIASTDTAYLFMTAGYHPTATATGTNVVKYGENFGRLRYLGNWQTTGNVFGAGTSREMIVAPWVTFNYEAGITVNTPSICNNSIGSFANASTPQSLIENRQFNFNKFASYWDALYTNTVTLTTDSIYDWMFTGASPVQSYQKNPSAIFNTVGNQTASLTVNYWYSAGLGGWGNAPSNGTNAAIYVDGANSPTITITGSTDICAGQSTTLTASGNATYTWTIPASNSNSIVVSPTSQTVYTVQAANGGCTATKHITVAVAPAPNVQVTGPSSGCVGQAYNISASGAQSYQWSNTQTTPTLQLSSTTPGVQGYTVTGTTSPACPSSSAAITITIHALPSVSLTTSQGTVCTMSTGGNVVELIGLPAGGLYGGLNVAGNEFTPNSVGQSAVTYQYTDPTTNCSADIATTITVRNCLSVKEQQAARIAVYPNPALDGMVNLENLSGMNRVIVYNILGEQVRMENVSGNSHKLDLSGLPQGQYFVRLSGNNGTVHTVKIVNQ